VSISKDLPRSVGKSPEFALLGFLYIQPCHGYELHQKLLNELGTIWSASQSETYNILKRLEARKFVKSKVVKQEKLPARNLLSLTPSGRLRFETWLKTPGGNSVRTIRLEFTTRLYFARQTGLLKLQDMIDQQVTEVRTSLRHLEGSLVDMPSSQTYNRLGLEYQIFQRKSILDWLDACRQTLNLQFYPEDESETLYELEEDMKLSARNILKGKVSSLPRARLTQRLPYSLQAASRSFPSSRTHPQKTSSSK